MPSSTDLRALLGPTNTGKTHRAIERMLEHQSGIIGLPLRLLAREVYDRVTARVGEAQVALVTGEERRVPARPRYWICTVEAMPDRDVDFVAVDEVQLADHPERGHVFTERILRARGMRETWFLGSHTMAPLMSRLVPTAQIERHPRLSQLTSMETVALGALPPRTAVVAFSVARVYELAERLRAKRGGAAVVIGALSPRARNAQVALFQSGEVSHLIATDAIGMGLNLDLDCVVFADTRKFDGRILRDLSESELAQIAGRAGRFRSDGRFGTLVPLAPLDPSVIRALEQHRLPPVERVWWRNHDLDFSSPEALMTSLRRRPFAPWLRLQDAADDQVALGLLLKDDDVRQRLRTGGTERLSLLWQICRIPDFRQLLVDAHAQLLRTIFLQLSDVKARIDVDWMEEQITRINDPVGDLDTLLFRMSSIRTFSYLANHADWVQDNEHWQARTRLVEDRLSDALHNTLVQRFVGVRARVMARTASMATAATRTLATELAAKVSVAPAPDDRAIEDLIDAPHDRFSVDETGRLFAGDLLLGRLSPGPDVQRPEVVITADSIGAGARSRLARRLLAWTRDLGAQLLRPLDIHDEGRLSPAGRGVLYQLRHDLGVIRTADAQAQLRNLNGSDRRILRDHGVRLGRLVVWAPALVQPQTRAMRLGLCAAFLWPQAPLLLASPEVESFPAVDHIPDRLHAIVGYPVFDGVAIRVDLVDGGRFKFALIGHSLAVSSSRQS